MIDDYEDIRPRRRGVVTPPPVVEDEYADIRPRRDTLSAAPERPSLLSRTATAALGLGKQMVQHPIDTGVGIAKGIGQNVLDAAQMVYNPMGASGQMLAEEGGDPRKTAVRMGGAASLALPVAGRAAGLGAKALAGMEFAASAGLGAAQTPDDPGVGAALGLLMNAAPYAPRAVREVTDLRKPMVPSLNGIMGGVAESAQPIISGQRPVPDLRTLPNDPVKLGDAFDAVNTMLAKPEKASVAKAMKPPVVTRRPQQLTDMTQDAAAFNQRALDAADALKATEPEATPRAALGFSKDGTYSAGAEAPLEAAAFAAPVRRPQPGLLDRIVNSQGDRELFDRILEQARVAERQLDDGLTAPFASLPSPGRIPAAQFAARQAERAVPPNATGTRIAADADAVTVRPGETQPPTTERFPNGYQAAPEGPQPVAQGVPSLVDTPAPIRPPRPVDQPIPAAALIQQAEVIPPAPLVRPDAGAQAEAILSGLDAPTTAPIAASIPEVPSSAPVAPAVTPAAVVDAPEVASQPAPRSTVSPTMQPAKEPYLNWRTITDPDAPLGKSTASRLESLYTANTERLAKERGFQGFDAQADEAAKSQVIKDLFDDPLSVDRTKLQGLTGAQVVAVKQIAGENARLMEQVSKELSSGTLSPEDMALAQTRLSQLEASTNEALGTIVGESARMGRDLGYLRTLSKLSTDPDVWMVHAKKALGDAPMTDTVMTQIRTLARAAADACGGA